MRSNDGDLDWLRCDFGQNDGTSHPDGNKNVLYRNDAGTLTEQTVAFTTSTTLSAPSCAWADFDGDGNVDALFAWGNKYDDPMGRIFVVYRNVGDGGTFAKHYDAADHLTDQQLFMFVGDASSSPFAIGDYECARAALIRSHIRAHVVYSPLMRGLLTAACLCARSGDGDLDVLIATYASPDALAVNDGSGNFTFLGDGDHILTTGTANTYTAAFGDYECAARRLGPQAPLRPLRPRCCDSELTGPIRPTVCNGSAATVISTSSKGLRKSTCCTETRAAVTSLR